MGRPVLVAPVAPVGLLVSALVVRVVLVGLVGLRAPQVRLVSAGLALTLPQIR